MFNEKLLKTTDIIIILIIATSLFLAYFWSAIVLYTKLISWIDTIIAGEVSFKGILIGLIALLVISVFVAKLILILTTKYYIKLIK